MWERRYECTYFLLGKIPSIDTPGRTVLDETFQAEFGLTIETGCCQEAAMTDYLLPKKICTTAVTFMTVVVCATSVSAQSGPNKVDLLSGSAKLFSEQAALAAESDPAASEPSASELAKGVTNPVSDVWSLQFQFNNFVLENGNTPFSEEWVNNLLFQPVMPVSLTENWNLITRPVITVYQSVPHPTATGGSDRTIDFGDTILAQVLSPKDTEPWIFGVGPTWIFPTAGSDFTGQGKWQVGPAIGGGYITDEFMIAGLFQQWWSFAGDDDRPDTSQLNVLPLIYRYFDDGWSVGYSGNILADWKADDDDVWTVPVGLSVGKIVKFGKLPVQLQLAGQYIPIRPEAGPEWNIQFQITPIIPKLIDKTLFP